MLKIKTPDWCNTFLELTSTYPRPSCAALLFCRLSVHRHKDPSAGGSKAHGGVNGVNGHGRGNLKAKHNALKITDQLLGLLLVVVSDSGLLDVRCTIHIMHTYSRVTKTSFAVSFAWQVLVGILEEVDCDPNNWRKATLLLGEILYMSNRSLPLAQAAKLQVRNSKFYGLNRTPSVTGEFHNV